MWNKYLYKYDRNPAEQIWKKSDWKILLCEKPKLGEEKAQTGGRKKSSSTAAPSELARGWSMRKCEFTCWEGQFCAELSTFNENFCHNLPWKKNSPGTDPSFSRPTSKSGSGNLTNMYSLHELQKFKWASQKRLAVALNDALQPGQVWL